MSQHEIDAYLHIYYDKDYLHYFSEMMPDTAVYRDTDIVEESMRRKTEFYQQFLRQADIPFGCGIVVNCSAASSWAISPRATSKSSIY